MKKKTVHAILIHLDWIETIKCLSHEQIGAFIIAMLDYANTGLLCVDELEASIHPNLMEYMLTRFVNKKDNQSQLIVTTHYDPILRDIDDIFGKDSVWFTEKGKDGNSNLFSLVEFRGLNKLSSIHRAYMNGQFGALPNIIM